MHRPTAAAAANSGRETTTVCTVVGVTARASGVLCDCWHLVAAAAAAAAAAGGRDAMYNVKC